MDLADMEQRLRELEARVQYHPIITVEGDKAREPAEDSTTARHPVR